MRSSLASVFGHGNAYDGLPEIRTTLAIVLIGTEFERMPLFYVFAVAAGVSAAFQQILNSNLRIAIGSPFWAGVVSYLAGMIAMLAAAMLVPGPRPTFAVITHTPLILFTGGFFGAFFIGMGILATPRLGAATTIALIVAGQMLGSLVFDHFGVMGVPQHPISAVRLAGAVLIAAGVVLVRL